MYYLRLENNGDDRAIYAPRKLIRFYRGEFVDMAYKYQGMKLYTTANLETIMDLRLNIYHHCNEWFDVYDENGKVKIPPQWLYKATIKRTVYLVDGVAQTENPKHDYPWYIAGVDYSILTRGRNFKIYKYNEWMPDGDEKTVNKIVAVGTNGEHIIFENKEQYFDCAYFS